MRLVVCRRARIQLDPVSVGDAEVSELGACGNLERVVTAVDIDLEGHGQSVLTQACLVEANPEEAHQRLSHGNV